jgi:hypothetical protein
MTRLIVVFLLALISVSTAIAGWFPLVNALNGQYFVANGGSDSNPGTQASPWQTIAKVNGLMFGGGACINFNGGQTFTGGVQAPGLRCITSYGAGQATISSGNSAACFTVLNLPSPSVTNIICTGGGNTTNTTDGIKVANTSAGNLAGPTISGTTISGYGANGVNISGTDSVGFNGVVVINNTIHDVTGNGGIHTSCIGLNSPSHSNSPYVHSNITITGNIVSNCTGEASQSDWSGGGIGIYSTNGGLVAANVASAFAANNTHCSGAGGFVAIASNAITFQFNEAFNGGFGAGGCDGNGFDIDGGATNIVMQYNWSHDNKGDGYLLDQYTGQSAWNNNVLRFNLSQNNNSEVHVVNTTGETMSGCQVYNNTLVNFNNAVIYQQASNAGAVDCNFSNNIIYTAYNAALLLSVAHPESMVFTGNDYFGGGTFSYNGSSYATFALWQTATSQEKIAGVNVGLTSNPQIYVPGGGWANVGYVPANLYAYNLQAGSPMIGAGLNLIAQYGINPGAQDYYGVAISAASLPIGAANGDFGTFVASCTAMSNFLARTSGFAKADNVNYNSLLCGFNGDGVLNYFDALYILAAPNSAASLLNLVSSSYSLTAHGVTTFTARQGILSDGSTGYLATGFIPSINGVNFTSTNASHGAYSLTSLAPNSGAGWGLEGAENWTGTANTSESSIYPGSFNSTTGAFYCDVNDFSGKTVTTVHGTQGLFVCVRTPTCCGASTTGDLPWFNGGVQISSTPAVVAVPNQEVLILAVNTGTGSGTVANPFFPGTVSAAFWASGNLDQPNVSRRFTSFMRAVNQNQY